MTSRTQKALFLSLCAIILLTPGIVLTAKSLFGESSPFNKLSLHTLAQEPPSFFRDFGNQLSENLILKDSLLDLYSNIRYALLRTNTSKKVVIGKNKWLYFSNSNGIRNARGQDVMSHAEAEAWSKHILTTAQVVENYGGKFLVVIVPDKPQVYPEHLPSYVSYRADKRRAITLIETARKNGLTVIDLLPNLLSNKNENRLYDKSDTHWTHEGGYLAYLDIHQNFHKKGIVLPIVGKEHLRVINQNPYSGDLARLLNLQSVFSEEHKILLAHTSYSQFERKSQLLVLGDSFSGRLVDYWNYSFAKTNCIHHRWGDIDNTQVAATKADVVLLMIVERGLQYPPQKHQIHNTKCF